ncbi:hypothetical protein HYFRA_00004912 [Hymenoscyphus fraxineus]|uniref:Uncharacterized protein n=1 Tax=Hymenoscyphus fraxineus TaxID=746836 RepID=A0A9N9KPK3_9HELO|nr:hypothetical protein HYFRA_00004912 [Hymenoscyphus fraxineus]
MVQFQDLATPDPNWAAPNKIHRTITALLTAKKTPTDTAQEIHQIITTDTQEAYLSYTSIPAPTASQVQNGEIRYPAPSDLLHFLFRCIGMAAMEISPHDAGQDHLIAMLQELMAIPRVNLPDASGGKLGEVEIYCITPENGYAGLAQLLWDLNQNICRPPKRDTQDGSKNLILNAYINYSSFLARLLEAGVCEVTNLSALLTGPFASSNKSFTKPLSFTGTKDPTDMAFEYEPYICAAAQWILFAPKALREMTEKRVRVRPMEKLFTHDLWEAWKEKFGAVVRDGRFCREARGLAGEVVSRMEEMERMETPDFVVERLGFVREDDEDDDDDDEDDEEVDGSEDQD